MKHRLQSTGAVRRYLLVFETGDEVIAGLQGFAAGCGFAASSFTAIGAFSDLRLGFFDWQAKDYVPTAIDEQVEVLALTGDIALVDGSPKVHAHVVVGKRDASAHGGHLLEAHVRPTLEVTLVEAPAALQKRYDAESGLMLIDPDA